ncbi:MAG TPA: M17 family peptidase N-terminal domain-containing protein, partial [Pyrinomonadaceae bacterium]|nr:M17 family peptidase N-terminal domain-containing protein [Pyrinomonadaceae bacterium]
MDETNFSSIELIKELPPSAKAVAVCVFEDAPHAAGALEAGMLETIENFAREGEFRGEAGTSMLVYAAGAEGSGDARRLLLVGLGARADFD